MFFRLQQQSSWVLVHSSVTLHFPSFFSTLPSSLATFLIYSFLQLKPYSLFSSALLLLHPASPFFSLPLFPTLVWSRSETSSINHTEQKGEGGWGLGSALVSLPLHSDLIERLKFKSMCWIFMGSWRCCARTYQYIHVELMKALHYYFQRKKQQVNSKTIKPFSIFFFVILTGSSAN